MCKDLTGLKTSQTLHVQRPHRSEDNTGFSGTDTTFRHTDCGLKKILLNLGTFPSHRIYTLNSSSNNSVFSVFMSNCDHTSCTHCPRWTDCVILLCQCVYLAVSVQCYICDCITHVHCLCTSHTALCICLCVGEACTPW